LSGRRRRGAPPWGTGGRRTSGGVRCGGRRSGGAPPRASAG
jgi:hypothetical protein